MSTEETKTDNTTTITATVITDATATTSVTATATTAVTTTTAETSTVTINSIADAKNLVVMQANTIYNEAESKLKVVLQDVWDDAKDDIKEWSEVLAKLHKDLLEDPNNPALQLDKDFVYNVGLISLQQKLRRRVTNEVVQYVRYVLKSIATQAVELAALLIKRVLIT